MLLIAWGVFQIGFVGATLLPDLPAVLVCRAAQGPAVLPLSFSIARRHLLDEQVGRPITGLMSVSGLARAVGFGTGGWMAQMVSGGWCSPAAPWWSAPASS